MPKQMRRNTLTTEEEPETPKGFKFKTPGPYDGKRDPLAISTWVYCMQKYLEHCRVKPTMAHDYASTYLEGRALTWYRAYQADVQSGQEFQFQNFDDFAERLKDEFTPQDTAEIAREKIYNSRQVGSVSSYVKRYIDLMEFVPTMAVEDRVQLFVRGLKPAIRTQVKLQNVRTLTEATRAAEVVEEASNPWGQPYSVSQRPRNYSSHDDRQKSTTSINVASATQKPKKTITCFVCGRPGHMARDCRQKKGKDNRSA